MAKDKLTDYSATNSLNTDVGGVNIDEGMLPSDVNNAIREVMTHLKDFAEGTQAVNSISVTGNVSMGSASTTGNITFGDNDKAIFGAGSDLQIYHTGSESFIKDAGTGNLRLQGTDVQIRGGSTAILADFVDGGAVTLRHNNSEKFSTTSGGIDVTGTVTADGLTVDGLAIVDDLKAISNTPTVQLLSPSSTNGYQLFANVSDAVDGGISIQDVSESNATRFNIANNGDVSLYDSTGVTQGFFWDASTQRLGLGTTSPNAKITAQNDSATAYNPSTAAFNTVLVVKNNTSGASNNALMSFTTESNGEWYIGGVQNSGNTASDFVFASRDSGARAERLRITSGGLVGIGTTSPGNRLSLPNNNYIAWKNNAGSSETIAIRANTSDGLEFLTGSTRMTITSGGNVGIGTSSPSGKAEIYKSSVNSAIIGTSYNGHYFESQSDDATDGFEIYQKHGSTTTRNSFIVNDNRTGSKSAAFLVRGDGNVGIGTSSPDRSLHIAGSEPTVVLENTGQGTDLKTWRMYSNSSSLQIGTVDDAFASGQNALEIGRDNTDNITSIQFKTGASSERMRIDSSGNVLVGSTTNVGTADHKVSIDKGTTGRNLGLGTSLTTATVMMSLVNGNGTVGTIQTNGTSTSYNTSSDYRLKENITDAADAGDKIDAIQVRQFDWIADGTHQDYGMIAQELIAVAPEAVSNNPDSDEMMGVDYSKLVPMLVKEIQQLRSRVAALEAN